MTERKRKNKKQKKERTKRKNESRVQIVRGEDKGGKKIEDKSRVKRKCGFKSREDERS